MILWMTPPPPWFVYSSVDTLYMHRHIKGRGPRNESTTKSNDDIFKVTIRFAWFFFFKSLFGDKGLRGGCKPVQVEGPVLLHILPQIHGRKWHKLIQPEANNPFWRSPPGKISDAGSRVEAGQLTSSASSVRARFHSQWKTGEEILQL